MKKTEKILEYLSDQIMQHNDIAIIFYKKRLRAQKVELKNKYYIDYKIHKESARTLSIAHAKIEEMK